MVTISYGNNGRFVFGFDTLGSYLEVIEYFNRRFTCHDNYHLPGEKLNPQPFHYLNEQCLSASTPIYVNIADYISVMINDFASKYQIETTFYLNDMERYAVVGAEKIDPIVRLSLVKRYTRT